MQSNTDTPCEVPYCAVFGCQSGAPHCTGSCATTASRPSPEVQTDGLVNKLTCTLIAEIERELGFIKATPRRLGGERAGVVVYLLESAATLLTKLAEVERERDALLLRSDLEPWSIR